MIKNTSPDHKTIPQQQETLAVYAAMSKVLAGQADFVDWSGFSEEHWQIFKRMVYSDHEDVGPLLYWEFYKRGWPAELSAGLRETLRGSYYTTLAHNTLLYQQLGQIIQTFSARGIGVLVLKGAALAATVYEDIGLRPMGDIDLLVKPVDLKPSWAILAELGFDVHAANTEIALRNFDGPEISVDLHWCIVSGYENDTISVDWFDLPTAKFIIPNSGLEAKTLHPTYHLPYVASHAFRRTPLRSYYDLLLLMKQPDIDLDSAMGFAKDVGWDMQLMQMINRLNQRLGKNGMSDDEADPMIYHQIKTVPRSRVILDAWSKIDFATRASLFLRILFPTKKYIQLVYGKKPVIFWPYIIIRRWFDLSKDLLMTLVTRK